MTSAILRPHPFAEACVCSSCAELRARAAHARRREAFLAALNEANAKDRGAQSVLVYNGDRLRARTGDIYRVTHKRPGDHHSLGTLVHERRKVRGKAARKAEKKARRISRQHAGSRGAVGVPAC